MNTNRRHAVAALIAAGLLWGTTVPLSKLALEWLSPGWLTAVRFGLAAAVLLAAARRRGLRAAFTPGVLVAGALGYGGSVILQNAGIARTSVTHAALLIGAVPVLVAIIAAAWHRIVARPVAWFGFGVSLAGIGLVTAGGAGGGATLAGDALVLASLFLSATVTVAQGRLLTGRDPVAVTAVQFLGATLGALPVAVVTEGAPVMPGTGSAGPVLAVVALAGFGTLLPFTLFAFGQSRVSAEVAGAFLNLEPLVGAVAGAVAFGDPVGLAQVAGGVAILAGIGLSSLPLLAGRRVARRADAARGAAVTRGTSVAAVATDAGTGRATASAGTGRPVAAEGRTYGCDNLHERVCRLSHPYPSGPRHSRRNRVFVMLRGGKFGTGHSGEARPGVAGPGQAPGRGQGTGPQRTLPGGRTTGRPPARGQERSGPGRTLGPGGRTLGPGGRTLGPGGRTLGPGGRGRGWRGRGRRPTAGGGRGGSGRRATGGRGRSWPGASRGR